MAQVSAVPGPSSRTLGGLPSRGPRRAIMGAVQVRRSGLVSGPASFLVAFGVAFALSVSWALTTPMFGSPDEISHMVRAAGAARGDLEGEVVEGSSVRAYLAPAVLVPGGDEAEDAPLLPCFAFNASVDASCLTFTGDRGDVRITSTTEGYPPVYYLLVGWPSRVVGGLPGLYAMRVASAALFAALVALAVTSIGGGRATAIAHAGLAVALTPMTWFLGASVNPSSMAISAAAAAWCGGFRLVAGPIPDGPAMRAAAARFGLPLCLLLLARRDSLLWAGLLVLALAGLAGWRRAQVLARSRAVLAWALASLACGAYAWSITAGGGAELVTGEGASGSASAAFGSIPHYFQESIGILGSLDTVLPSPAYVLFHLALGALLAAAVVAAPRRVVLVVAGVAVASVAAVVAIGSQRFPYYQGRYGLPFTVGIPVLAGLGVAAGSDAARIPRRATRLLLGAVAVVHVLAFYQQLRRYSISGETTWWAFSGGRWRPPTAPVAVLVALNVAAVVVGAIVADRRGDDAQRTGSSPSSGARNLPV